MNVDARTTEVRDVVFGTRDRLRQARLLAGGNATGHPGAVETSFGWAIARPAPAQGPPDPRKD